MNDYCEMSQVSELRVKLDELFPQKYELDVGAGKTAIVLVIDASFAGQTRVQCLARVAPLL